MLLVPFVDPNMKEKDAETLETCPEGGRSLWGSVLGHRERPLVLQGWEQRTSHCWSTVSPYLPSKHFDCKSQSNCVLCHLQSYPQTNFRPVSCSWMLPSARVTLGTATCPRACPVSPKAAWNGMIVLQAEPVCTAVHLRLLRWQCPLCMQGDRFSRNFVIKLTLLKIPLHQIDPVRRNPALSWFMVESSGLCGVFVQIIPAPFTKHCFISSSIKTQLAGFAIFLNAPDLQWN